MSDVVIQSLVNLVPVAALVLGLYYFLTKQMNTMENRLREDSRESENRLRAETAVVAQSVETAKSELRTEIVSVEERLRSEIKVVAESVETAKSELRAEIVSAEERLRSEIKVVAESVETAKSELRAEIAALAKSVEKGDADLSHRMDRTDDKISRLIQDVGVVQGAVLGVSVEAVPREQPAGTN